MANTPVTGTINYSGATTSTDTDVLTLGGWNSSRGGRIELLNVTNLDDTLILYVRTDATTPTAAAADGTIVVNPGTTQEVAIEPGNQATGSPGTVVIRLVSTGACGYNVVARRAR